MIKAGALADDAEPGALLFFGLGIAICEFDFAAKRETGDVSQLLQALGMRGRQRLMRPDEFAIHRFLNAAAIPCQNLGAEFDAGAGGRAAFQKVADDDPAVVQFRKRQAQAAIGLLAEVLAEGTQGHADVAVRNLPEEIAQGERVGG